MEIKIRKIIPFLLLIDFILIAFSAAFMDLLNLREVHVVLGITLLLLGTIHIMLQHFLKNKRIN